MGVWTEKKRKNLDMFIYGSLRSVSTNCLHKKTLTSSQLSFHPPEVPLPYYSPRRRTHKNFTLQAAEETTAMAPISLALVDRRRRKGQWWCWYRCNNTQKSSQCSTWSQHCASFFLWKSELFLYSFHQSQNTLQNSNKFFLLANKLRNPKFSNLDKQP
jgi:hypothetical protein